MQHIPRDRVDQLPRALGRQVVRHVVDDPLVRGTERMHTARVGPHGRVQRQRSDLHDGLLERGVRGGVRGVDHRVNEHPRRDRRISPGCSGRFADLRQPRRPAFQRQVVRDPAVAIAAGELEHLRPVRGEPDRRLFVQRPQLERRAPQREELADEVDRIRGAPQQADDLQRLAAARDQVVDRQAVRRKVLRLAGAEPEDEASLRSVLQRERRARDPGGMQPQRVGDGRAETDALRARRKQTEQHEWVVERFGLFHDARDPRQLRRPHPGGDEPHHVVERPVGIEAATLRTFGEQPVEPHRRSRRALRPHAHTSRHGARVTERRR